MSAATATVSLPEICDLVTDGTHDSPKLQPSGVPFIKGKHISSGRVDFSCCDYITEQDHLQCIRRVKPQRDDVLFSNIGSVGDAARVVDDTDFSIKNVALFRPCPRRIDPLFFYYLVISPYFKGHFLNVRSGSAQPFISLESFRSLKFRCLQDRNAQARIGGILSAYDDLIENNRRRIELLEQAARLLYKEWFVHLRFPGHEHVKIIHGVPSGWKRTTIGEFIKEGAIDLQTGPFGTQLKASDYSEEGTPVINVRNIGYGSLRPEKIEFLPEAKVMSLSKHILQAGDIVFGRKGAVDRHVLVGSAEEGWIQGSDCIRMRIQGRTVTPTFVSLAFRQDAHKGWILSQCGNKATMASLNQDVIARISLLVPSHEIMASFGDHASQWLSLMAVLQRQADAIAAARDLLLPRMMNGEVAV